MLGTGTRFAEYGITGGFLIVTQTLVLAWIAPETSALVLVKVGALLTRVTNAVPGPAQSALQSLLVALALLSVFIAGLLLELAGSYYVIWEAGVFRDLLVKNRPWISKLIDADLKDYAGDYAIFLQLSRGYGYKGGWAKTKRWFTSWKRPRKDPKDHGLSLRKMRKMRKLFRELESLFVAKIVASGTKIETLAEQISVCRMSRAITSAAVIVATELLLRLWYASFVLESRSWLFVLAFLIPLALMIVAIFISVGAYSRFCLTLFSLLYASSQARKVRSLGEDTT